MIKQIITFFHRKKMVHSRTYEPAQYYRTVNIKGKRMVRCVQTNRPNRHGSVPMIDIPVSQVIGIRRLHSPFQLWLMNLLHITPSNKVILHPVKFKK